MRAWAAVALLAAGCASAPMDIPAPPAPVEEPAAKPEAPASDNVAVANLVLAARGDAAAGKLTNAGATLERALRLEPRNPRLWHELALVRLQQGDFAQAESLAERSNSWAGGDTALRLENSRLIARSREARGTR